MTETKSPSPPQRHYRSGAVARMLRMPVATLRIWERRYRVSGAATSAAGHRLYSAADVQRLALLKQLTALGHAIGVLAALEMAALQAVARTHASTLAEPLRLPALPDLPPETAAAVGGVAPRRFDDAVLGDVAGLSSTIACECPQHLAEILLRLTEFEAYSADCRQRSPADASLHAYLQQVAGQARASFEKALERVAIHEGLLLPARPDTC
jgi:DNA-binding transcriptional MerR regulator